jgi:phosphoribosyl 1,2-cyclic phosphodiesterase
MKATGPDLDDALRVTFWGVRGSTCCSGPEFTEFGGHTPCVEIRLGDRLFVVDAGTGLGALGAALGSTAPDEVDVLLSHLHLDHVGGLPFFKPVLLSNRHVRIHCGNLGGGDARECLDRLFSPPLFPIKLDQLPATVEHVGFVAGETLTFEDGAEVRTCPLKHPSGATGYRFTHRGRSVCYISDVEHEEPWPPPQLRDFVAGADLVIYDAMFSETEYGHCRGWGHSTWQAGVALCREAGAKAMAVFHLHPLHDDAHMRGVEAEIRREMPSAFVARQGLTMSYAPAD